MVGPCRAFCVFVWVETSCVIPDEDVACDDTDVAAAGRHGGVHIYRDRTVLLTHNDNMVPRRNRFCCDTTGELAPSPSRPDGRSRSGLPLGSDGSLFGGDGLEGDRRVHGGSEGIASETWQRRTTPLQAGAWLVLKQRKSRST